MDELESAGSITLGETLPGAESPLSAGGLLFERGACIGRYVLLDKLGAGAMGIVLAAYDPDLDRKVAIKLLKSHAGDRGSARVRLQREAQALAKLDHPNVVRVHDVGVHDDQLFVAMEFVAGRTLRAWMTAVGGPRPWREVVGVFTAAGRGLAAAHGAGLIHRDFKPDNVMIGDDGRVRVMDFGLVRTADDEEQSVDEAGATQSNARLGLTRTGALIGTIGYMTLQQFEGKPADAHSDQFSFCVGLHEALYGERPFVADGLSELIDALEHEEIMAPSRGSNVPNWLRKLIMRGLARDPAQRWPSMQALLDALADDPVLRRRRWAVAVGIVGLIAGGVSGVLALDSDEARPCADMEAKLADVWDDARRAEVETAILATGSSHASGTLERVEQQLDEYASAWVAARVETCEASHRGEQSGELLDLRMACLDERLSHLRVTVDELARVDAKSIDKSMQAVLALPSLDRCADVDALRAEIPPPEDPELARQVRRLDEQLLAAQAKKDAGRFEEGLALADAVVREASELGWTPLLARAWLQQGGLRARVGDLDGAEAVLIRAYDAALAQGMTAEAAQASSDLVFLIGYVLARPEQGRSWAIHATRSRGLQEPTKHARSTWTCWVRSRTSRASSTRPAPSTPRGWRSSCEPSGPITCGSRTRTTVSAWWLSRWATTMRRSNISCGRWRSSSRPSDPIIPRSCSCIRTSASRWRGRVISTVPSATTIWR